MLCEAFIQLPPTIKAIVRQYSDLYPELQQFFMDTSCVALFVESVYSKTESYQLSDADATQLTVLEMLRLVDSAQLNLFLRLGLHKHHPMVTFIDNLLKSNTNNTKGAASSPF